MRALTVVLTVGLAAYSAIPAGAQAAVNCSSPTIVGTPGNDNLVGSPNSRNVIAGLAGDDALTGGGKADSICAGEGNDRSIAGGKGNDLLSGGPGSDKLIDGGNGRDLLEGEAGNDELKPGHGTDTVRAGAGSDQIANSLDEESDEIYGDADHDTVSGPSGGSDRIFGGDGNDILRATEGKANPGADRVEGGAGSDTCFVDPDDTVVGCETVIV